MKESNTLFNQESYQRHAEWQSKKFTTNDLIVERVNSVKTRVGSIGDWTQNILFEPIDGLLEDKDKSWFIVGDSYGHDAYYLLQKGVKKVLTSDLNDDILQVAKTEGIITEYDIQNAEKLTLEDNSFNYVLCKESYHHFPRPFAAMYEMLRVSKDGVVVIEPQDPVIKMPSLLFLYNFLMKVSPKTSFKIWKNRISYEPVGNFVYKVSIREFEKLTAGLALTHLAFKQTNVNFWFEGAEKFKADNSCSKYRKIRFKKRMLDFLTKIGVLPGQTLTTIIFKTTPTEAFQEKLKKEGFTFIEIPKNPYI